MRQLGAREVVGLAALLFAVAVAAMFLNPANSESTGTPGPITLGTPVGPSTPAPAPDVSPTHTPTPSPTATPTPTPLPLRALPSITGGWLIGFSELQPDGSEKVTSTVVLPALDLSYLGAPFGDFKDNAWGLSAETAVDLPAAGRFTLPVEHDCALRILIDGKEIANDPDGPSTRTVEATFEHAAGQATITVECRDRGGPFVLRVK
jgi:hypothetical protein